ncbi:MAG: hypothetical protein Q8L86_20645 [Vicinamibacterales bacterium]|nr:hypothetical protein [Vicinamibacterales bacterium]
MIVRCALVLVAALVLWPSTAGAQGRDALAGVWRLNNDLTSTPPDIDASRPPDSGQRPRAGMGGSGGPGGRVGPGRMGGSAGGGQESPRDRQRMRTLLRRAGDAPARLTVVLDGARVLLTDNQGRTTTLPTDNRKQELVTGDGEIEVRAKWDNDELVVEEDFGSRMKITYYYAATTVGERRQLRVRVAISGGPSGRDGRGGPPPLTRVYDLEL